MKYKIKIPSVEHTCTLPLGGSLTSDGGSDIQAFLRMLEKHNIPFVLTSSIEGSSTKNSTILAKDQKPATETTEK